MRRLLVFSLTLALILVGCGRSEPPPSIDLAAVEAAIGTPGDLLRVYAGPAQRSLPEGLALDLPDEPAPDGIVFRLLNEPEGVVGNVAVISYPAAADAATVYAMLSRDTPQVATIGERAALAPADATGVARILFVRCHALVKVTIKRSPNEAQVYAGTIDMRIRPIACK